MRKVLVVGGGPVALKQLQSEIATGPELIIAADSGGNYFLELGIFPDVLIGDFDSLSAKAVQEMVHTGVMVKTFPAAKEETDLELAMDLALEREATQINILGGLGERIDHTLGNIGILQKALDNGVEAHLLDERHDIVIVNQQITLAKKPGWAVSLIPLSPKVSGVTTSGLVFKLEKADLYFKNTRGIHNEFLTETASVELTQGILMVIIFKED